MKKIVIVCFTFPPFPGIGGRRWAKFARYLNDAGHDIQVIAAEKVLEQNSAWVKDTIGYRDKIHFLPSHYPDILTVKPIKVWDRIKYKLALEYVKLRNRNGNYFDPSSFFGRTVSRRIEDLLQLGYNNVIISCGPFRMTDEILKLKDIYPNVNFILDFRDAWTDNKTSFGFLTISNRRRNWEGVLEKRVLKKADYIVSVSNEVNYYFESKHDIDAEKLLIIPNGFDYGDLINSGGLNRNINEVNKWVYTGTLYTNVESIFSEFCNVISNIVLAGHWPENMILEFYGTVPDWFYIHSKRLENIIKYMGNLPLKEVFDAIGEASACMLFLGKEQASFKVSKYYDYIAMKRPVIVISPGGETGDYVAENKLGYNMTLTNMKNEIERAIEELNSGVFIFPNDYKLHTHDVKELASCILKILQ